MIHEVEVRCAVVLIDMDGVLVRSTDAVERAWGAWALHRGEPTERVMGAVHGRRSIDIVRELRPDLDPAAEASWIEQYQVSGKSVSALPGAERFVRSLGDSECAVVTSATRRLASARMRGAGLPPIAHLISADDVADGKPAPDGYLAAARALGVRPEECVVIEDAPAGLAAARAAHMRSVAVRTTHRPVELIAADVITRDLSAVRAARTDGRLDRLVVRAIEPR